MPVLSTKAWSQSIDSSAHSQTNAQQGSAAQVAPAFGRLPPVLHRILRGTIIHEGRAALCTLALASTAASAAKIWRFLTHHRGRLCRAACLRPCWTPASSDCAHTSLLPSGRHQDGPERTYILTHAQPGHRRRNVERTLVQWQCWIFVASWTGVIKYHGPRPAPVQEAAAPWALAVAPA